MVGLCISRKNMASNFLGATDVRSGVSVGLPECSLAIQCEPGALANRDSFPALRTAGSPWEDIRFMKTLGRNNIKRFFHPGNDQISPSTSTRK